MASVGEITVKVNVEPSEELKALVRSLVLQELKTVIEDGTLLLELEKKLAQRIRMSTGVRR